MGRPPFKPTDDQREQVEAYVSYGATHEEIAELIGVTPKTLRAHFRAELDRGSLKANMKVAGSVFRQAVGAPAVYDENGQCIREEQKPIFAASAFWMKCRAGWRETSRMELTGKDGGPVETIDLSKATDEQLKALEDVFGPLAAASGDDAGDSGGEGPAGG